MGGLSTALAGILPSSLTCGASPFDSNTNQDNGQSVGRLTSDYYSGQASYTLGSNSTICKVVFYCRTVFGSVAGKVLTAYIYDMSGNNLNTLKGTSSNTITTPTTGELSFTFNTALTAAGSPYAFVLSFNSTVDAVNYINIGQQSGQSLSGNTMGWDSSKAMQENNSTQDAYLKLHNMQ